MSNMLSSIKNNKGSVEAELGGLQTTIKNKGGDAAWSYAENFSTIIKRDGWKLSSAVNSALSKVPKGYAYQSTANGVKVTPYYAMGGVVPGNSMVGDKVMIRANSGEMILNREQQSGLFNFLRNLSSAPRNINFGNVTFGGGERSVLQEQNMFMNLLVNAV
jgi:hypothetical protein